MQSAITDHAPDAGLRRHVCHEKELQGESIEAGKTLGRYAGGQIWFGQERVIGERRGRLARERVGHRVELWQ